MLKDKRASGRPALATLLRAGKISYLKSFRMYTTEYRQKEELRKVRQAFDPSLPVLSLKYTSLTVAALQVIFGLKRTS
jgi:hypothetical protein